MDEGGGGEDGGVQRAGGHCGSDQAAASTGEEHEQNTSTMAGVATQGDSFAASSTDVSDLPPSPHRQQEPRVEVPAWGQDDPLRALESRLDELLERNKRQQQQTRRRLEVLSVLDRMREETGDEGPGEAGEDEASSANADHGDSSDDFDAARGARNLQQGKLERHGRSLREEPRSRIPVRSGDVQELEVEVKAAMEEIQEQLQTGLTTFPVQRSPGQQRKRRDQGASRGLAAGRGDDGDEVPESLPAHPGENRWERQRTEQDGSQAGGDYRMQASGSVLEEWSDSTLSSSGTSLSSTLRHGHTPHDESTAYRDYESQRYERSDPSARERRPRERVTVQRMLGKELSEERQRRLKAEGLVARLQEEVDAERQRLNHAHSRLTTVMSTLSRLEDVLSRSTQKNKSLQDVIVQKNHQLNQAERRGRQDQDKIRQLERELRTQSDNFQTQAKTIMQLKDEVQRANLQQLERVRAAEMETLSMQNQAEMHRQALRQANRTIKKLQATMSEREARHARSVDGLISPHGPEVQRIVAQRERELQTQFDTLQQVKERELDELKRRYQSLEGEYHAALHYERQRCAELEDTLARTQQELQDTQTSLDYAKEETAKNGKLLEEMAGVIEQQRSHVKQQSVRIKTLTREKDKLARQLRDQKEQRRADQAAFAKELEGLKEAHAKIEAQENVIRGLREERELWSQELANQGASLAADRGKLESTVQQQQQKIEQVEAQLKEQQQAVIVKEKLADDQAEELKLLRQRVADAQRELSRETNQHKEREQDLQDRLDAERELSQQLQADLQAAVDKKTRLREELSKLAEENDTIRNENARLKSSWEDTGMKLGQLELEVQNMERVSKKREEKAVREKEEAERALLNERKQAATAAESHKKELAKLTRQHEEVLHVLDTTRKELEEAYTTIQEQATRIQTAEEEAGRRRREKDQKLARLQALVQELGAEDTS